MPRLSFLFRTDTHVSDRNPVSWKGDYQAEIWSNLEKIGSLAQSLEVNAVLDGGDYFHPKAPTRTSHATILRSVKVHESYGVPTYGIAGNHDMYGNDLGSLPNQPLGVLFGCGAIQTMDSPTFQDGRSRVRVVGVPYSPNRTLEELLSIQKTSGDEYLIAVVHALATEKPASRVDEFFNEPVFRYGDLVTRDGPDAWSFGHWHKDQGVAQIGGKWFVNQGALSRGSLTHENMSRIPQVALFEFDNGIKISTIPMDVAPAEDVFDIERKERNDNEMRDIQSFVAALENDAEFDPEISMEQNLRNVQGFSEEVANTAIALLAEARGVG